MPPTAEEVPSELAQLPELAVSGSLGRFQLLRLDKESALFERFLQLFSRRRLATFAFDLAAQLPSLRFLRPCGRRGGRAALGGRAAPLQVSQTQIQRLVQHRRAVVLENQLADVRLVRLTSAPRRRLLQRHLTHVGQVAVADRRPQPRGRTIRARAAAAPDRAVR